MSLAQPIRARIDMQTGLAVIPYHRVLMQGDKNANRMTAELYNGGTPFNITEGVTVGGTFVRKDGTKVPLEGTISGNEASVLFNDHCYAQEGTFKSFLHLISGETKRTVMAITGNVAKTGDGATIDVEDVVPDMAEIIAVYEEMKRATQAAMSATQEAQSATQSAADIVAQYETVYAGIQESQAQASAAAGRAETAAQNTEEAETRANAAAVRAEEVTHAAIGAENYDIPVLKLEGPTEGMDSGSVPLVYTYTDKNAMLTKLGVTYYSDWAMTVPAGTTDRQYKATSVDGTECFFMIGITLYYLPQSDCTEFKLVGGLLCKWQGTSSLAYPKKNYTVKFDTAFEAKSGWGVQTRYCLKANWVDASNLRNILGATLWGKQVKKRDSAPERLKALPNGGAVDGFPIWVIINGVDQGIYTMSIPKDAWLFGITESDTAAGFICAESYLCDRAAVGDETDIEIEYAAGDEAALLASFNNMIEKLNAVQSEADLPALEAVLDMGSVVDYYAHCAFIHNHDGVQKNYILATYDGAKWFMSAYDMDATFGNKRDGSGHDWFNNYPSLADLDESGNKLFVVAKTYYKEQIRTSFQNRRYLEFGEADVSATAYTLAHPIPKVLAMEDFRLWPSRPATNTSDVSEILNFVRIRGPVLDYQATQL